MYKIFRKHTGSLAFLASSAQRCLQAAFAASTTRDYETMFKLFLAFLVFHQQSLNQVDVFVLLAFFELLHLNNFKHSNILNHSAAIKSKMTLLGLDVQMFNDQRIHYFFKAIQKSSPLSVAIQPLFDIPLLERICLTCDNTYQGQPFKVTHLLGFFCFLRLSNLCPHSATTFDMLKHLTRGDFFS